MQIYTQDYFCFRSRNAPLNTMETFHPSAADPCTGGPDDCGVAEGSCREPDLLTALLGRGTELGGGTAGID